VAFADSALQFAKKSPIAAKIKGGCFCNNLLYNKKLFT